MINQVQPFAHFLENQQLIHFTTIHKENTALSDSINKFMKVDKYYW